MGSAVYKSASYTEHSLSQRNERLLKSGKTDGFEWFIGAFDLIVSHGKEPIYLAYVDVSGTKLDGISETSVIDELGIEFCNGCTFAGRKDQISLFKTVDCEMLDPKKWFLGEDYLRCDIFYRTTPPITVEDIEKHIKNETIPSLLKAFILMDLKKTYPNCK